MSELKENILFNKDKFILVRLEQPLNIRFLFFTLLIFNEDKFINNNSLK